MAAFLYAGRFDGYRTHGPSGPRRECGVNSERSGELRRANSFRPSILNPKGFPEGFAFREMGAGYAGGIVSAAVDGIRVAEAVARG